MVHQIWFGKEQQELLLNLLENKKEKNIMLLFSFHLFTISNLTKEY